MSAGVGYRVDGVHVGVGVRLCVFLTSGIAGGYAEGMSGRRGVIGVSLGVGVYELASEERGGTYLGKGVTTHVVCSRGCDMATRKGGGVSGHGASLVCL